jgi:hypothetical protein
MVVIVHGAISLYVQQFAVKQTTTHRKHQQKSIVAYISFDNVLLFCSSCMCIYLFYLLFVDGGIQIRTRSCSQPAPSMGGKHCAILGPQIEQEPCNTHSCAIHGGYTMWGQWSSCTAICKTYQHMEFQHICIQVIIEYICFSNVFLFVRWWWFPKS